MMRMELVTSALDLLSMARAEPKPLGGKDSFVLSDEAKGWLVVEGCVDLFATEMDGSAPRGARQMVTRIQAGQILLGVGVTSSEPYLSLLAVPGPGAKVQPFPVEK